MAKYSWAKIEIGGKVSISVLNSLAENFDVSVPKPFGLISHLKKEDDKALWGRFQELETYLVEQAIPFNRVSDGGDEHDSELRRFRPKLTDVQGGVSQAECDRTSPCGYDDYPAIASVEIGKAIAETQTRQELIVRLTELCGLDIPDLPPLKVS